MDQASNFFENIDEAITANNNLQDSIYTGNTLKTNLDNNITTGNTLNNDLETNISAGNILKPNLEGAVTSANTAKAELDISIQDANTFVSEHGDIIDLDNRVTQNTSQLNEKVNKTAIINNCNVTEEGFIADARQLKYLFDLITKINNTTSYTTDLNIEKSIISKYNSNTLNTPYKQGLVTAGIGVCLTFMDGELQIAFPYMDNKILMRYLKGTWVKVSA